MSKFLKITQPLTWSLTVVLAYLMVGCGGDGGGGGGAVTATPAPAGSTCTGTGCVDLRTAANYVVLSETNISYTPTATVTSTPKITGNIGVSPAAASFITGFALNLPAGGTYSTSTLLAGAAYASDYAPPTPANLTTAIFDRLAAYSDAKSRTPAGGGAAVACPGTGAFGGVTLTPGVYECLTGISIAPATNLMLSGAGVYIIKTTGSLTQAASTRVDLTNGALPQNVFWQVEQGVSIGASAHMEGVILSATDIALVTGATVKGRLLSKTSVAMDNNTVTQP